MNSNFSDPGTGQYPSEVRRVAVIGAGTMGSGIAAHLANLGFHVLLFDRTRRDCEDSFHRAKHVRPPHFYLPSTAASVEILGIDTDIDRIREADWVCEAIVERLDLKRALFQQIEPHLRQDAFITTNTSGLQLALLAEGRSDSFRSRFVGSHFFNPPRYLKLMELIPTHETDPVVLRAVENFLEESVAKRVVVAKDTPGFIANRFGMWSMYYAVAIAEKLQLSVEEVDAITGAFLGRPKSASFRLNDLVGLDVMEDIATNLITRCPEDPHVQVFDTVKSVRHLIAQGAIGQKVTKGFYRKDGKEILVFDLRTQAYRQRLEPELPILEELKKLPLRERIAKAIESKDKVGDFLRHYLIPSIQYAITLQREVSHSISDFDNIMKWGFGWEAGPFELADMIGEDRVVCRDFSGTWLCPSEYKDFYRDGQQLDLQSAAYRAIPSRPEYNGLHDFPIVEAAQNFNIRDLGDGVLAIGTTTKLGVFSPDLINELTMFLRDREDRFVLTSESAQFSVGFDLKFLIGRIDEGDAAGIDEALIALQSLGELLETKRVVSAVRGYCLGGGFEVAMSCPQMVALAESTIGLPEAKVGLIPGGRGVVLSRLRNQHSAQSLVESVMSLTLGTVSTSADHARQYGYLRETDLTCYHPDMLIWSAKQAALRVEPLARPEWKTVVGPVTGMIDRAQQELISKGELTNYDETIGDQLKAIYTKVDSYELAVHQERARFLELVTNLPTVQRIKHMLEFGKPLRN